MDDKQYFQELLHEEVLAKYIDDFVMLAKTKKELEEKVVQFLKVVEKYNLCFKWRMRKSKQLRSEKHLPR